jgi:hypothetical protein
MKIQAYLTAAAIDLKRLAAALLAEFCAICMALAARTSPPPLHRARGLGIDFRLATA